MSHRTTKCVWADGRVEWHSVHEAANSYELFASGTTGRFTSDHTVMFTRVWFCDGSSEFREDINVGEVSDE